MRARSYVPATRLSAATREQRYTAMRLVGAIPRQVSVISAVEAALAAVAGMVVGFGLYAALCRAAPGTRHRAVQGEQAWTACQGPNADAAGRPTKDSVRAGNNRRGEARGGCPTGCASTVRCRCCPWAGYPATGWHGVRLGSEQRRPAGERHHRRQLGAGAGFRSDRGHRHRRRLGHRIRDYAAFLRDARVAADR